MGCVRVLEINVLTSHVKIYKQPEKKSEIRYLGKRPTIYLFGTLKKDMTGVSHIIVMITVVDDILSLSDIYIFSQKKANPDGEATIKSIPNTFVSIILRYFRNPGGKRQTSIPDMKS